MSGGVVDIGYVELFSASALMLVAGLVSWKLELGQTRRIVVSSVRCFMQLLAAGFLLTYLFEFQTWWLVALVLAAMVIAATQIAVSRVKSRIPGLVPSVFMSLFVSSLVVGFIVVEGVVHADPWFNARQVVPIVGMIMGNADPLSAAKYQIVVMLMLSAANTVAIVTACFMTYRKRFAPDGYYLDEGIR